MRKFRLRTLFALGLMTFVALITGCAHNPNIDTDATYWQHKPKTIVIVTTHADKPQYADENGSKGVIIDTVNLLLTHQLETHLSQMDLNWYYDDLAKKFQQTLVKENITAVIATEHPYLESNILFSKRIKLNYAQLAAEYNADQILVLALPFYGARQPLQPNIFGAVSPIEGACVLYAELSDPQHTTFYWRHTSTVTRSVLGNANQPPDYPNLTRTIIESHEMAEEELLDSLRSGR
ncbi:MAG: hypothetical protein K0R48_1110 [Gammaproteobacteria bacterium]|jgi:hypothetical protein|nr:hypothetical protein [Gammaproteobacteria bacterium]